MINALAAERGVAIIRRPALTAHQERSFSCASGAPCRWRSWCKDVGHPCPLCVGLFCA